MPILAILLLWPLPPHTLSLSHRFPTKTFTCVNSSSAALPLYGAGPRSPCPSSCRVSSLLHLLFTTHAYSPQPAFHTTCSASSIHISPSFISASEGLVGRGLVGRALAVLQHPRCFQARSHAQTNFLPGSPLLMFISLVNSYSSFKVQAKCSLL